MPTTPRALSLVVIPLALVMAISAAAGTAGGVTGTADRAVPDGPAAPRGAATTGTGTVDVAVVNLREGTLVRRPADLRGARDRDRLASRVLDRPGDAPDVVLLQEVLGSAGRAAEALDAAARRRGLSARYSVATTTASTREVGEAGECDGVREGSFAVLRSSAVLVNTATVTEVVDRGVIRTWGRWFGEARRVVRRGGYGCSEHPWVRAVVVTEDGPVTATVASVHVAPSRISVKNRAIVALGKAFDAVTAGAGTDLTVLGGDLNLDRCRGGGDLPGCHLRPGHRWLVEAGFRDAVRDRHPSGPHSGSGVDRRIDFVYSRSRAEAAWWDRCYQGYRVLAGDCGRRSAFASQPQFALCEARADEAPRPGGGCSASDFDRYYSDHPLVTASLRAPG